MPTLPSHTLARLSARLLPIALLASCLVPAQSVFAASSGASTLIRGGSVPDRRDNGSAAGGLSSASDSLSLDGQNVVVSASSGKGSLSTFASAIAAPLKGSFLGGIASASLTDSFVVRLDGSTANRVLLDFAIHASGDATFSHGDLLATRPGGAKVDYSFAVSGLGFSQSVAGSRERGVQIDVDAIKTCSCVRYKDFEIITGEPLIDFKLTLEAAADTANSFTVSMSSRSLVSVSPNAPGSTSVATADFGNTFTWLGLERAYLPDGTPYTGPLSITSESGFNYGRSIAPVPEPSTYAMFLLGLIGCGWVARRRRS